MRHMVRISDDQVEKLKKLHPEWASLDFQDMIDVALASMMEVKKK